MAVDIFMVGIDGNCYWKINTASLDGWDGTITVYLV